MPVLERTLAVLALVALGITVVSVTQLARRRVAPVLVDAALPLATAIAFVATVGSLAMSEVAGYTPCVLCWYQRIAMYPLVVILLVAAVRRDRAVWCTAVPIAGIGAAIAAWHVAIEHNPSLAGDTCDPAAPCALRWVEEFGFLTLPTMVLIGFLAIIVLTLVARHAGSLHPDDEHQPPQET
ncbi:MAG: disulfide bond formation protein B [Nitriliruptoraceae bacterium]